MSTTTTELSAQERAIQEGKKVLHGTVTERVLRMFEAMRAYGPPRVSLERGVLFTEAFKANEHDPLVLRWAKALKHYAEKSSVVIFDDELIVGRTHTWMGRWGLVYPELDGAIMPDGVKEFRRNKGKIGEVVVTEDDEKIINDVLTPYWSGRDYATAYHDAMPEETRFMMYGPDPKDLLTMTLVMAGTSNQRHSQNWTPDWSKLITRGCKAFERRRGASSRRSNIRETLSTKSLFSKLSSSHATR